MGKHLSQKDINDITNLIDDWKELKFTWELLCKQITKDLGFDTTRQTLTEYISINEAYKSQKKRIKNKKEDKPFKPRASQYYIDEYEKLKSKVERLEKENNSLKEQFILWMYNANSRNVGIEILNKPLPSVDKNSEQKKIDGE
jgi:predicted RNase H-like nuclease (RuvC/YqgF family)